MKIHVLFSCLLSISLFYPLQVSGKCRSDQSSLLLQMNSTFKLVKWDLNSDCCNWDGVECDGSGNVISLDLNNRSISSDLKNVGGLFGLQYLQKLNLANNNFANSQIPSGIGSLTGLTHLNFSNSGFGGQVPIELSSLRSLVSLDLSSQFQWDLPLKIENPDLKAVFQKLIGLKELYLDSVNMSSQGSQWGQYLSSSLPNLRNLSLRSCGLSGPLDSLAQLRHLSVLQLDRNILQTTVPDFFSSFSNLKILTLGSCSLSGTFPNMIFQVPTLQILDLSNNLNLSGTISQFPSNGSFRSIVLSYTGFSGSLPNSICNLSRLSRIELSNCSFSGPIPSAIGNLTELVYLDLSVNSFNGSIPSFPMSKKLTYIDLSRNSLTGSLKPAHFVGLSNLVSINIGHNALTGTVPHSLLGLPLLQKLDLSNNKFSGQVEFSTWNSPSLDTLDLSSNQLEGSISETFFNLEKIKVLSLHYNSFNGTVHLDNIRKLPNLTRLELGHNNLSVIGSSTKSSLSEIPQLSRLNLAACNLLDYPDLLKNQSKLIFLDLSKNHIIGKLPRWIWHIGDDNLSHLNLSFNHLQDLEQPLNLTILHSLKVLDLHSNKLHGEFPIPPSSVIYVDYSDNNFEQPIPDFIIFYATFFSVANNTLSGTIPPSLCQAAFLQVLDLSDNNLNGSLPPCLMGNITTLGVLNLGRNNINGSIPDTFSVNCTLKTLDISRNDLGGKIPKSLANCRSLEVLNVGNNKLQGGFPCMLKDSSNLRVLVLRNNKFDGDLRCPRANESWPNLQIIDLASNNFTGHLSEKCISNWRGMALGTDAKLNSNHLSYEFLSLNKLYYQDTVTVTIKGQELAFSKILKVLTSIDFSQNNFHGIIPEKIGDLNGLYVLNLSRNSFNGSIPKSIGNLEQLESLDLSYNQLSGQIPEGLTRLTFLSFLNLSYNKLVGMIPNGRQFQTFTPSSFTENIGLCGYPLNRKCNSDREPAAKSESWLMDQEFDWQFVLTGLGYGVGAALVIAPLAFCKQWREECNDRLDQFLKLIIPGYGFSYIRFNSKVMEDIENVPTEDEEEDDDEVIGAGHDSSGGIFCVFCTKLDIQMKRAIHNPKCACHYSPPTFSSSLTSSSSSLLFIYQKNI